MVWHCWFPIHPRLKSTRALSGSDIGIFLFFNVKTFLIENNFSKKFNKNNFFLGFKALRLGLEGLAVRNRSNMYVYREQSSNIVYMRLHSSEESVFQNITLKSKV